MREIFFNRIREKEATTFSQNVFWVVQMLEKEAKDRGISDFKSPLLSGNKFNDWEDYAYQKRRYVCDTLPVFHFLYRLEDWYVALRVLIQTWEEDELLVMHWLSLREALHTVPGTSAELIAALTAVEELVERAPQTPFKLLRLLTHITEKKGRFGDAFCCIVFVQRCIAAHIISDYINQHLEEDGIRSGYVTQFGKKITPSIKMNKTKAQAAISDFRNRNINVLVATSVVEEVRFDIDATIVVMSRRLC